MVAVPAKAYSSDVDAAHEGATTTMATVSAITYSYNVDASDEGVVAMIAVVSFMAHFFVHDAAEEFLQQKWQQYLLDDLLLVM